MKNIIIFLALFGMAAGCAQQPQTVEQQAAFGRSYRLRGALIHVLTRHDEPPNLVNRYPVRAVIEALATDDEYATAAEAAVFNVADDNGVILADMSFHDLVKWVWTHRDEIVDLLTKLLPLFVHK